MATAKKTATEVDPDAPQFRASHRVARVSPRKARLVMDMIRGDSVEAALTKLRFCQRRSAPMILKVVESAVANAAQSAGLEPSQLFIQKAVVDKGPTLKRFKTRSMGRSYPRLKRTCHLSVIVRGQQKKSVQRKAADSEGRRGGAGAAGTTGDA